MQWEENNLHDYLKSIGFKEITTKKQEDILIKRVIENPYRKKIINIASDNTKLAEFSTEFAPGVGVKVTGQLDDDDKFYVESFFPYIEGREESTDSYTSILRKMNRAEYSGMCDDDRFGASLIFHVVNPFDHILRIEREKSDYEKSIKLSGLCYEGAILLPTVFSGVKENSDDKDRRINMVSEAKNGNSEALQKMTLEEMDTFTQVCKRVYKQEDIFSIVETSLIPFGVEAEVYKILGNILEVNTYVNAIFKEKIYVMKVKSNDIVFDLCINQADLQGEPKAGRRFRGLFWMQGAVTEKK